MIDEIDISQVAEDILGAARRSTSEEDFKIRAVKIFGKIFETWNVPWDEGKYEYTLVSGIRADALYGHVVIEYEKPGTLEKPAGFAHAVEQLKGYIKDEGGTEAFFERYFGIALDGYKIGFVRFRQSQWLIQGPFDVNRYTIMRLIEAIRGLRKKLLEVELLVKDLGPESDIARKAIRILYEKLRTAKSSRTKMLFGDWRRVFSQVCAYSPEKIRGLDQVYGITEKKIDFESLLFSVHTYYSLVMKLLAAEIAILFGDSFLQSYLRKLEDAYYKSSGNLKEELQELEEGGIFVKLGIMNFLEADYFAWYLDEWDDDISESTIALVKALSEYEPATAELEPERVKDLFKRLYQHLVPKKIRHDLGEYYTPDWLAELLLNEAGFTVENLERMAQEKSDSLSPLNLRLLDPGCGSGTFLVLIIRCLKDYADGHWLKTEALERIVKNVVGFDLNPLAVMASRANYIIALGDLLRYRGGAPLEIPVYLADSISVERKSTLAGAEYLLRTTVGQFSLPVNVVERGFLGNVLSLIEECVRLNYKRKEFETRLAKEAKELSSQETSLLSKLFEDMCKLEKQGQNRIWVRLLRNSFAPLFKGRFDFVIGNPPWVNWESLPESYRDATKDLWIRYGLIRKAKGPGLGKVKRDIAMLFVTVSYDRYLSDGGTLSFLVPFTAFRTQAGAGFRTFLFYKTEVRKVHDLVELAPFEGALNRTALLVLAKSHSQFPVKCTSWTKMPQADIGFESTLDQVYRVTERREMILEPIGGKYKPESSWLMVKPGAASGVRKALGVSQYRAYAGVYTALNSAYWIDILSKLQNTVIIRNLATVGKKHVKEATAPVEKETVYPLIRGRDVKKWSSEPSGYILIPHDPKTGRALSQPVIKEFPKTFAFLSEFRRDLERRPIHRLWGKGNPFYAAYDIGNYTFAPYKVMWKYVAGKISGKGEFSVAVVPPTMDKWLGSKTTIPNEKLMLVPFKDQDEAHYVASLLNSSLIRLVVASYAIETAISTHILKNVRIPKFDSENAIHKKLSELSKEAHILAAAREEEGLSKVETEIDKLVSKLYGLTDDELREAKESLALLLGHEFEEEEVEEEIELEEPSDQSQGRSFFSFASSWETS